MTLFNQVTLSSLPRNTVEMIEKNPQQFEQILNEVGRKSKKRRIQKKVLKLAVARFMSTNETEAVVPTQSVAPTSTSIAAPAVKEKKEKAQPKATEQTVPTEIVAETKPHAVDVTDTFDFSKLPVGFVLKTGKQFFKTEDVFRFYYNQNHPDIYKNKNLLMEQFTKCVNSADDSTKAAIKPLLEAQLAN